jgi:glycosyltransferase involved in cell wall biosynthesis
VDRISAVIITLNEERNIGRCLASLKEVAAEVVVVDAGSTDRTVAIAQEHGARVVVRQWTGYSDQKNFANSLAQNRYVLSMDADEALSPGLQQEVQLCRRNGLHGAYRFPRLTNYCGSWVRHGGWYPDAKVRLFPRDGAHWEGAHVHEELKLDPALQVFDLKSDLLHYSYHSTADHEDRICRYSTLHARRMLEDGRKAGLVKRYLSPLAKFIQGYVLQLGFLDGRAGLNIAWYSARAVAMKYRKLKGLREQVPRSVQGA